MKVKRIKIEKEDGVRVEIGERDVTVNIRENDTHEQSQYNGRMVMKMNKIVYQVCRKLYPAEKRHPMMAGVDIGVYTGYFESEERAEEFADKVGGWIEKVIWMK